MAAGGLRSVAWVDCLQCILLMLGITFLGITTLNAVGGGAVSQTNGAITAAGLRPLSSTTGDSAIKAV